MTNQHSRRGTYMRSDTCAPSALTNRPHRCPHPCPARTLRQHAQPVVLLALLSLVLGALLGPSASAQDVLPRPDYHFQGQVGRTFQDSDPAGFPQLPRPPRVRPISC